MILYDIAKFWVNRCFELKQTKLISLFSSSQQSLSARFAGAAATWALISQGNINFFRWFRFKVACSFQTNQKVFINLIPDDILSLKVEVARLLAFHNLITMPSSCRFYSENVSQHFGLLLVLSRGFFLKASMNYLKVFKIQNDICC